MLGISKGSKNPNLNNEKRQKLNQILETEASLKDDLDLRKELKESKDEINLNIANRNLKQVVNLNMLQLNDLQQYSTRENIRIYGISELQFKADDGKKVIIELAKESKIELEDNHVQRAQRLGKKEIYNKARPTKPLRFFQK